MFRLHISAMARPWFWTTGVLLLGICLVGTSPARAAQMDKALLGQGGNVLHYLNDKGYRNVGVLPFQVKKGTRSAGFADAPLALNLTTRMENALIVSQDPTGKKIGIIRDAVGTANRREVGAYQTSQAAFKKLFAQEYELAWGNRKVKADAFLTGTVVNSGKDRARTSVVVEVFNPASMKSGRLVKEKICAFDLPTDRSLLSDLGYAWALSPTVLMRGITPKSRDQLAVQQVAQRDEQGEAQLIQGQSKAHTPGNIAGMSFEILYDDVKQPITPLRQGKQGQRMPLYQVPPAPAGARIVMVLTRRDESDRTLGVILKVNGQSTWRKEDMENIRCRKWLYSPAKRGLRDPILGFYMDTLGRNLLEFRSLTAEESEKRADELGSRVGWFDIEVFASGTEGGDQADQVQLISTRSVAEGARKAVSLKALQAAIRKANNIRLRPVKLPFEPRRAVPRELIDAAVEPIESVQIEKGSLPNPESLGSIAIRYWEGGKRTTHRLIERHDRGVPAATHLPLAHLE